LRRKDNVRQQNAGVPFTKSVFTLGFEAFDFRVILSASAEKPRDEN
jgi:hypothetical protein